MKKRLLSLTLIAALCLSLFPTGAAPALAASEGAPDTLLVGGTNVKDGGYWTTTNGTLSSSDENNWNVHYDASNNTLTLNDAKITGASSENTNYNTVGIYAGSSGDVSLEIKLQGENTITSGGYGIWVYSPDQGGAATLNITGENGGSLNASGSGNSGIQVQSNSGNATLSIENAKVTATSSYNAGVVIQSSDSSDVSLTVDGGNLTATGSGVIRGGIEFRFGTGESGSGTPSLNVSNSAIVKASGDTGGITSNSSPVTPSGTGIVFNNGTGTVYGSVTLQEDLTIGEGESLTIPDGASLTIGSGATLTVNGGELTGNIPTNGVVYKVTGVTLSETTLTLEVGDTATLAATVTPTNATNQNVTWESSNPSVAAVDESGKATAVTPGEATITVTTEDGSKTATCTVIVHTATTITTQPQSVSVTEGQSATFSVTATGDNLRYQWQINSGNGWSDITGATDASYTIDRTTTAMGGNQYCCVVTGDGGETTSSAATLTVNERPTIPPVIPPTVSEETIDAILDAEPGETVTVALEESDTVLDADVFETLAGQDITLEIALEGGVTWTVNGQDIPANANLDDLDLGVEMDSDGIPVDVVNSITGERDTVQMTLAHDGDFGFTMTLTAPLGAENAGYWANLYHYDEDAERLSFETAARIDDNGNAALPLSHASQYAIVIDDHSHATIDLPFSDVSAGDWFYDPVCYVYAGGLMTGVSDTAFAPEATTTRAMIVSMLARMENVTNAADAGFADVAASDWYATAVNWAAANGIVNGISDDTFAPNDPITREQLAAMLMNYAQWKGQDISARADLSDYTDAPSTWASEAVQWAVAEGLLAGVTDDQLQPQGQATRAQVAAILERFLEA